MKLQSEQVKTTQTLEPDERVVDPPSCCLPPPPPSDSAAPGGLATPPQLFQHVGLRTDLRTDLRPALTQRGW